MKSRDQISTVDKIANRTSIASLRARSQPTCQYKRQPSTMAHLPGFFIMLYPYLIQLDPLIGRTPLRRRSPPRRSPPHSHSSPPGSEQWVCLVGGRSGKPLLPSQPPDLRTFSERRAKFSSPVVPLRAKQDSFPSCGGPQKHRLNQGRNTRPPYPAAECHCSGPQKSTIFMVDMAVGADRA